jgi:L-threonylcarbamoyladenylate synthase
VSKRSAAVFLDRDGTLIEDVGMLKAPKDIRLFPDTIESLRKLQHRYQLFVVTNQSGVARGLLSMEQVNAVNTALHKRLLEEGITIQEWYVCPHSREQNCTCIKPKPQFLLEAAKRYGVDLTKSFVIGDHPHDVLTANSHGVFGLYLLTGHGGRHLPDLPADKLVFHRLSDAADWICSHPDPENSLDQQIEDGAAAIRNGGVTAFPTETVYGLGADVFQPDAVKRIFAIKGRPQFNPLIAHIADMDQLDKLVPSIPENAMRLMEEFWPGPLTIVLPKRNEVPDIVTAGMDTVAVRMPENPIALDLIRRCRTPIAAPSANKFTYTSPTTARHVKEQLGSLCDTVIDGGACRVGVESTVISFTGSAPVLLRPGGVPVAEIERLIGSVATPAPDKLKDLESPGMLPNHYAPATPLSAFETIPDNYNDMADVGVLLFGPTARTFKGAVETLSQHGDAGEAASNLYAALRRLDALGLREIVAEYAPHQGLGQTINNRLSKAAKGRSRK